jgi:prepilin-type N-terminal cleavage/methylation domain-containing protein
MRGGEKGFTLLELMVVVVVIGIIAAMTIPDLTRARDYAREASVRSNMHTLQMAMEDYATIHDGVYATNAEKALVKALVPRGEWPKNPFKDGRLTDAEVTFGSDPDASGEMGINPSTANAYVIRGFGKSAILSLVLSNGL